MYNRPSQNEPNPVLFISYAHFDNNHLGGKLSKLGDKLAEKVRFYTGIQPDISRIDSIGWGENRQTRIEELLNAATFFIPVITPNFFTDEKCPEVSDQFLRRERELGRNDLVLPIYFVQHPPFERGGDPNPRTNHLIKALVPHQYVDWRNLHEKSFDDKDVQNQLDWMAQQIMKAWNRTKQAQCEKLFEDARYAIIDGQPLEAQIRLHRVLDLKDCPDDIYMMALQTLRTVENELDQQRRNQLYIQAHEVRHSSESGPIKAKIILSTLLQEFPEDVEARKLQAEIETQIQKMDRQRQREQQQQALTDALQRGAWLTGTMLFLGLYWLPVMIGVLLFGIAGGAFAMMGSEDPQPPASATTSEPPRATATAMPSLTMPAQPVPPVEEIPTEYAAPATTTAPAGIITFHTHQTEPTSRVKAYIIQADGTNLQPLNSGFQYEHAPVMSPDGTRIVFFAPSRHNSNKEIYVINRDSTSPIKLTNDTLENAFPDWSPDGKFIVFYKKHDSNQEIYVMNADGSNPTNLTNHSAIDDAPAWSPDGSRIAFMSERDGNQEIYVMNADGSNPTNLTKNPAPDLDPAWSPDGRRIAFMSKRDGNQEIYVMNADGSNPTNLTNHPAPDYAPTWSPDGRFIAFVSDRENNQSRIYIMDAEGNKTYNLTGDVGLPGEHYSPAWCCLAP